MAPRPPRITPNTFLTYSSSKSTPRTIPSRQQPPPPPITIFFISGNPGLIGYYHTFLSLLSSRLSLGLGLQSNDKDGHLGKTDGPSFQIYGRNLGGFELDDSDYDDSGGKEGGKGKVTTRSNLYDLEEQVGFVQGVLEEFMVDQFGHGHNNNENDSSSKVPGSRDDDDDDSTVQVKPKVILIGHSVGSYIAMEVLRRHREKEKLKEQSKTESGSVSFDIIGGIMLFPTVVDIAKSASGRKLTKLLYFIPQLALVAGFLTRILTFLFPDTVLRFLIGAVMKSPPAEAVETTLAFLKSKQGVRQALHMASSEMQTITTDKWTDDIWGVSSAQEPLRRLFFYFGRNDHWVADKTRDEIIELRGRPDSSENKNGPKMFVCEDGLPHAFCLRHNDIMARKVAGMIDEIILGR